MQVPVHTRQPISGINAIAQYIKNHTTPSDRIAVFGSEPQIYFYAQRPSVTGYIYTYGLMEDHQFSLSMQKEMITEIENAKPAYIVFVNVPLPGLSAIIQRN